MRRSGPDAALVPRSHPGALYDGLVKCFLALMLGVAACGETPNNVSDANTSTSCAPSCFETRWWIGVSYNCTVLCMGSPNLAECMRSDCEAVEARRYVGGQIASLAPMLYSAEARSFYLLGSLMTNTYASTDPCMVRVDTRPAQPFTCEGDSLTFSTAVFHAASTSASTALDTAFTTNTPGRYSY